MNKTLSFLLLSALTWNLPAQVNFQEIDTLAFLNSNGYYNGVSWVDFDNDNDLDVCVSGFTGAFPDYTPANSVFVNQGNNFFENTGLIVSNQANSMRHGWGDVDNDGYPDIYFAATWNQGGINEFYRNNNGASFTLNPSTGATPNVAQPYEGAVSWADYDNDGFADLFLPRWNNLKNRLFHNEGNGSFTEITAGELVNDLSWTSGGFWGDFDNDRDQDIYVVNYQTGPTDPGANDLFRNNGDGTFTKLTGIGAVVADADNSRSANWVDIDNDGFLDLFVANQFDFSKIYRNNGDGAFAPPVNVGTSSSTAWSSNWGDFDNDGDQDLLTMGFWDYETRLWENDGAGNLTDVSAGYADLFPLTTNGSNSNGVIWVDYDLDGWLDLHMTQPDVSPDKFFRNQGAGECRTWLAIDCIGEQSNSLAIGTTVRAKAQINGVPVWQMRQVSAQTAATGSNPFRLHFGLGNALLIDSLVVEWPSGQTCVFEQVAANQFVEIPESCSLNVIQGPPAIEGSFQPVSACGDTLLTPLSGPDGFWQADCGACIDAAGFFDAGGLDAGTYTVLYQIPGLCGATTDTFEVALTPLDLTVTPLDTTVNAGNQVSFLASGADTYSWSPAADLSCADCPDPVFSGDSSTVLVVTAANAAGCIDSLQVSVTVLPVVGFEIPNIFTPNNDGQNDLFQVLASGDIFAEFRLEIYNRWGQQVFVTQDPNQGWDGLHQDLPAPADVYGYFLKYRIEEEPPQTIKGEVTLLR